MTKYELFKRLSDDLLPLILDLEKDIKSALSNNKANPNIKPKQSYGKNLQQGLHSLAKSIFTKESNDNLLDLYLSRKNSLQDYQKLENKIQEICTKTIEENIDISSINEDVSEIPNILQKFKQNFVNVIKNLSKELQSDYDQEKAEYMKTHGSDAPPDSISDSEVEKIQSGRSSSYIDQTLEEFSKLPDIDENEESKFYGLLKIYAAMNYGDDHSILSPLLKKIVDEKKYDEAKKLLNLDLQKELDSKIKEYEENNN